jgi:hypothetical protein
MEQAGTLLTVAQVAITLSRPCVIAGAARQMGLEIVD